MGEIYFNELLQLLHIAGYYYHTCSNLLNSYESAVLLIKSRVNWPNMTVVPNREAVLLLRNIETH